MEVQTKKKKIGPCKEKFQDTIFTLMETFIWSLA